MSDKPLWGTPPHKRPIRGAAKRTRESARGRMNARDAGAIFNEATIVQGAVVPLAMSLEAWAHSVQPGLPVGVTGLSSWALSMVVWLVVKVLATVLANYGHSLVSDFGAWLWEVVMGSLPIRRRRRRRNPTPGPDDGDGDDEPRRGFLFRLLFRRRRE